MRPVDHLNCDSRAEKCRPALCNVVAFAQLQQFLPSRFILLRETACVIFGVSLNGVCSVAIGCNDVKWRDNGHVDYSLAVTVTVSLLNVGLARGIQSRGEFPDQARKGLGKGLARFRPALRISFPYNPAFVARIRDVTLQQRSVALVERGRRENSASEF